jgi:hypothetical protein
VTVAGKLGVDVCRFRARCGPFEVEVPENKHRVDAGTTVERDFASELLKLLALALDSTLSLQMHDIDIEPQR